MTLLGHLGTKVSDLLDERLDERASASAWAHVADCPSCQQQVETEAWVKRTLSTLATAAPDCVSDSLKGRLSADRLVASYAAAPEWTNPPAPDDDRRHRWTVAAIGGGAVGAAMLGIVALGVSPQPPAAERRPPTANLLQVTDALRARTAGPARVTGTGAPVADVTTSPQPDEDGATP
ncbi:hypothetical protein [Nocardioides sp. ChNu-99]|uniref:hypothetical protein n=1 Tax=Nocardioides sp. ChNu-99 TaxID=2839897 RepID=UPI002404F5C6|nr:hypothetical protein [Nocardioides sp. ChNu-99]MDF9716398.1 hypothetical protein [Nocardioides sp. ChNu-99]